MKFSDLGLNDKILQAVAKQGYDTPSPIQQKAIPFILKGRDVLAGAQTGTGKTAAFTLPLLQNLGDTHEKNPRALILTPTRELAAQVADNVRKYSENMKLTSMVIFGGVGMNPQIKALKQGMDILVATPGRLMDLLNKGHVNFSNIEVLILDEADRMLDMGFIHDIRKILKLLPKKRQNLMFSATYSDDIRKLAAGLLNNAEQIEVAKKNATAANVTQKAYGLAQNQKTSFLEKLIKDEKWPQVLIFTRTKHGANRLALKLDKSGIPAAAIHGNKSQNARTRALADFKSNKLQALVATDIAARGIDIHQLPNVVNYELPNVPEDYVHRIGRTGRAGATGLAVSLVAPDERAYLRGIEKLLKKTIEIDTLNLPQSKEEKRDSKSEHSRSRTSSHSEAMRADRRKKSKPRNFRSEGGRRGEGGQRSESRSEGGQRRERRSRSGGARRERRSREGGQRSEKRREGGQASKNTSSRRISQQKSR